MVEDKGFDQYMVKVDGTERLTRRNCKYLKILRLYSPPAMPRSDRDQQCPVRDPGLLMEGSLRNTKQLNMHVDSESLEMNELPA